MATKKTGLWAEKHREKLVKGKVPSGKEYKAHPVGEIPDVQMSPKAKK